MIVGLLIAVPSIITVPGLAAVTPVATQRHTQQPNNKKGTAP